MYFYFSYTHIFSIYILGAQITRILMIFDAKRPEQ